jgi:N-acetylated-alpha-linked acidic dipeptidase
LTKPTAWIDTYYPLLNYPLERKLQILDDSGSVLWNADVEERAEDGDESGKYAHAVGAWHGLSKGGDVTGEVIFASRGRPEDFEKLAKAGIDPAGKIALIQYGGQFRGLKVKAAQEAGCVGALIYSDPRDDGTVTIENGYKPYPQGPARNPTSVQRGSVQFLSMYPGDPTTPGYPSYPNATRQSSKSLPSIPSLPISWANAERLMEEVEEVSKDKFVLGATTKRKVRLLNQVNDTITPVWNSMAVIPGHIRDEVVILGNHRDAWVSPYWFRISDGFKLSDQVMGAADPTSGTVSMHEIVRGYGELLRQGWKPLRTILFASWDAEEYGLIASTEYGEDFAEWLKKHVVAYLNLDVSVSGSRLRLKGSPSLAHLIRRAAEDLPHPTDKGRTLWDARLDSGPFHGIIPSVNVTQRRPCSHRHASLLKAEDTEVGALGSGSDYTVFLQRIGIASTDQGFGATLSDAVYHYHSVYDSQTWQEKYGDPGFHKHVAIAKHLGLVSLRLASSIILPINTTQYSLELENYLEKVELLASSTLDVKPNLSGLRRSIRRLQKASQKLDVKKLKAEKALRRALKRWRKHHNNEKVCAKRSWQKTREWIKWVFGANNLSSTQNDRHYRVEPEHGHKHTLLRAALRVHGINKKLSSFEGGFISEGGIRDREWYRHLGVAPGKWLGYGATTFPALTEAIRIEKNVTLAEYEAERLTDLISKLAHNLNGRSPCHRSKSN